MIQSNPGSLPSPDLDDRSFDQLVAEAKALVLRRDCGWTDLSPGDPGAVLIEVFAYLTSLMLYRLNRVPDKVQVELLRLIGVKLAPPAAARARLSFSVAKAQAQALTIPAGTRVTVARTSAGEAPVFTTAADATIPAGETQVDGVTAWHCTQVDAERVGTGTGLPRQTLQVQQPPIIAPTGDDLDLLVAVEATPDELGERVPALTHGGRSYRIWHRVEHFADVPPDSHAYVVDRLTGTITFAPALRAVGADGTLDETASTLARVPAAGREIRVWYRRGGGPDGNVAAQALTVLRDPVRGVSVTNPEPASGGSAAETVDHALLRGPQDLHSLRRAVTARDYEAAAVRGSGAVARAKAFTKAELWRHAPPGTVEVLLVPQQGTLAQRGGGRVTRESLAALETEAELARLRALFDERRPLGTACLVNWVRYKTVQVQVRVVVHRGEDMAAVAARVQDRLHMTINPLPTPLSRTGWRFGEPLRASHVYDIVLAEPGVSFVDRVRFRVDEVPDRDVRAIAIDPSQPATWYAASGAILYRSLNDADGWEGAGRFDDQTIDTVCPDPSNAGLLAVATLVGDDQSRVHVSRDCGETWAQVADLAFATHDLAWTERSGIPVLLLATDKGLYELALQSGASPAPVLVDKDNTSRGWYAVVSFADGRGGRNVALASRQQGGIWLSRAGGGAGTYERIHPGGPDVRVLAAQRLGLATFLWAGTTAAGNEAGQGCLRWELPSSPGSFDSPEGWRPLQQQWQGGSCRGLAFDGVAVYAATHHAGVATLDSSKAEAGWTVSHLQCGLPMRGSDKLFAPVQAVAVSRGGSMVLAGGAQGVFRSRDRAARFDEASSREFPEKVALPPTWLFCSAAHEVQVVSGDEADRD